MTEEKQEKRGRRSPRSPEKGNFRSRLGIVEQHYLEAIQRLFVLAKTVSHPPPGAPRKAISEAISGVGLES